MPHRRRDDLRKHEPVHITVRLKESLPSLRREGVLAVLRRAFVAGCDKDWFRLVHWSVQSNHIHMIVEADDQECLSMGM